MIDINDFDAIRIGLASSRRSSHAGRPVASPATRPLAKVRRMHRMAIGPIAAATERPMRKPRMNRLTDMCTSTKR